MVKIRCAMPRPLRRCAVERANGDRAASQLCGVLNESSENNLIPMLCFSAEMVMV
jgi:hypothetical protein